MSAQTFGPFEIEKKLGVGGMGVVYQATHIKTRRKVALKVLTPALSQDEKLVARFEREMEILKKLQHPNVVRYFGGGKLKRQHFYAMELMPGGSLEDLLKQQTQLSWQQTLDFGRQICAGLSHAHDSGVIHRDLKPANLFLTRDGRLRLGDFGIARDTERTALTAAGSTVGTYAYMAPEQITGNQPISARTDLYALGCVMFEMLAGHPPFMGKTPAELLMQHIQAVLPPVGAFSISCPKPLEEIVTQLLQKSPNKRPHDAAFLEMKLEEVPKLVEEEAMAVTRVEQAQDTASMFDVHPDLKQSVVDKKKRKKKRDKSPFYERAWFLSLSLLLLIAAVTWAVWPASEEELFAAAKVMMESDDSSEWQEAKHQYLEPLQERFPDGQYAEQVQEYLDKIETDRVKRRVLANARRGREPESESERLFREAWNFEQFGDRVSALEKYEGMIELLKDRPGDQAYVGLARQQIQEIESSGGTDDDRVAIVNKALADAAKLYDEGHVLDARKKWSSIVTLYASNSEFERQVAIARARRDGDHGASLNDSE
jgi:eukaryotic-like serine/threonine-protein kinase